MLKVTFSPPLVRLLYQKDNFGFGESYGFTFFFMYVFFLLLKDICYPFLRLCTILEL
jgi:hypothetical protein